MRFPVISFLAPLLALLCAANAKTRHSRSITQQVVYTTPNTDECKLLNILLPYVTMLEAVLEQYFKTDADAAILFKLLGTLGRHVIVRNDAAEVRPALVKESVSFMREYEKFAHWLSENYKDNSLLPIAGIMDKIFAARFGKRLKIIENEMKKLGKEDSWNELMRFWNTVNATDTEKLFAMSAPQLKSLDKFLDRTKTMAMEHKSFELLYQTHVLEALSDLARSMTTRRDRNMSKSAMEANNFNKPLATNAATSSKEVTSKPDPTTTTTTAAPETSAEPLKVRSARDEEFTKKKDVEKKDSKSKESSNSNEVKGEASDRSAMKEEDATRNEHKKSTNKRSSDGGNKKNKKQKNSRNNRSDSKAKRNSDEKDDNDEEKKMGKKQ